MLVTTRERLLPFLAGDGEGRRTLRAANYGVASESRPATDAHVRGLTYKCTHAQVHNKWGLPDECAGGQAHPQC